MVTRRSFLAGAASLAGTAGGVPADATPGIDAAAQPIVLDVQKTRIRIAAEGALTETLRFGGTDPVPVIRVRPGAQTAVQIRNGLTTPTSLQWQGLRGIHPLDDPAVAASSSIPAGQSRAVTLAVRDSGTAWFHPDPASEDQTAAGLRGVLIAEEAEPPAVDADLVVLMADWSLDGRNQRVAADVPGARTVMTLNGRPAPMDLTHLPGSRLRLRLVNGSTRRIMVVACAGGEPRIIAVDGQPSELFAPIRNTIPMGPGARFDILLDLPVAANAKVDLILKGTERLAGVVEPDRTLLTLRTAGNPRPAKPPFTPLRANPALPRQIPLEAAKRADLVIAATGIPSAWTINGVSGITLPTAPVLRVKQGSAVSLGLSNKSAEPVALHVHGQAMRLLHAKDDGWEPYWRDTVLLPPASKNHVAFVADVPGRWLIDSAFNAQAVGGLRCWLDVTKA